MDNFFNESPHAMVKHAFKQNVDQYNILMKMYKQTGELCFVKVYLKEKALEI